MSQPMTSPLLAVRGLRTWFETPHGIVRAVEEVSLDVDADEAVGIVGESGSGKTQTFFSILGLSHGRPGIVSGSARFAETELLDGLSSHVQVSQDTDGSVQEVRKNEHRWKRVQQRRLKGILGREISLIFQEPRRSLVPYWTVGRHLEEVLRRRDAASEADELLVRLGFRHPARLLRAFPEELSGGEAQRVMLALAIAARPRLLIADEPTTAVDPISQARLLDEIERIYHGSNLALVLISHDLAVVRRMVSRVVVMYRGRVVEEAPSDRLDRAPSTSLHPYTLALRESQKRRAQGLPPAPPTREDGPAPRPTGCPYTRQCLLRPRLEPERQRLCEAEMPPLAVIGDRDHRVACWGIQA